MSDAKADCRACPHCGRSFGVYGYTQHERVCVSRPHMLELVRGLLERPDAPGKARSSREYAAAAIRHNAQPGLGQRAPSERSLDEQFGGWRAVCAWTGLEYTLPPTRRRTREDEVIAEVAAAVDDDRAMQRELERRGLEVCRVRALPDGRVACMLR